MQDVFKEVIKIELWIDTAVAKMNRYSINQRDIAEKYPCSREMINRILRGKEKPPKGAKEKILNSIDEIIASKL